MEIHENKLGIGLVYLSQYFSGLRARGGGGGGGGRGERFWHATLGSHRHPFGEEEAVKYKIIENKVWFVSGSFKCKLRLSNFSLSSRLGFYYYIKMYQLT